MTRRKTVFISCGQFTDEERQLGKRVCDLVTKNSSFEGYFAQNQTTLRTLSENVLRRLYESVGLVVIMHHRGKIEGRDSFRASVWIEQEIAIATLMEQLLGRPLHVALFVQGGIAIEGIRQQIQLNPIEFTKNDEVIAMLGEILPTWTQPLYVGDDERQKTADSVMLSVKTDNGNNRNYTIQVENHSKQDVDIKCISLWSKNQIAKFSDNQRISRPAFRPENANWCIPAQRTIPIQFDAQEDVAYRLWQLAGTPRDIEQGAGGRLYGSARQFQIEVRVVLLCEVCGLERSFEETRTVQVDFVNRHITGI
jgi:hypothetical protein